MSLKLGATTIAGLSKEITYISNAHQLLDFKWSDHLLDDMAWLRADTFSWQDGIAYDAVYTHLVADIDSTMAETETIGNYTVTFYRATDGHKICLADQESAVLNIYNSTGIAWYYIVDTTNTQFKLPRTKYGFEGLRTTVGDKIDESLPTPSHTHTRGDMNITGTFVNGRWDNTNISGCFYSSGDVQAANGVDNRKIVTFDASRTWTGSTSQPNGLPSTYQNNAPVQERATQMYLYFYVGDYTQSAIEQTAGLNAELFNNKVDLPAGRNQSSVGLLIESYVNGASGYRVYSDGYCEQWGYSTVASSNSISLLRAYSNTDYSILLIQNTGGGTPIYSSPTTAGITASSFAVNNYGGGNANVWWKTCGYIN